VKRSPPLVALGGSVLAVVVFAQPALAASATFGYTGGEQTFSVPAGVTSVRVVAIGGSGGAGTNSGGAGGAGAQVSGDLSVTPGQVLFIEVAGNGQSGASGSRGGFNGGAAGGNTGVHGGGGGGGASDVRTAAGSAGLSPDPRLLVAAGGGGGGVASASGGAGGSAGSAGDSHGNNIGGGAGTASAGGAGGSTDCGPANGGLSGQLGAGGAGGADMFSGGGGAGGLYGGGGGAGGCDNGGAGGGGGSSLVSSGGTSVLSAQQPQVQISYTQPPHVVGPSVFSFGFDRTEFRAAGEGGSIARKHPVGARVRYRLSEAASAKFTVQRAARGRKRGKKCVPLTRRNRRARRCTRYRRLRGSFTHAGKAGLNSFRFTGRLRGKKLRPGRYRLTMVATDSAGNRSRAKRARFRIVRR
jgi:Glycine rich protein